MAIGHPFVDVMLEYVGSYDFGGLTAIRQISSSELAGQSGYLFIFVVRQRITREDGDECLFRFCPVFVDADGRVNEKALEAAIAGHALDNSDTSFHPADPAEFFEIAKAWLESSIDIWDWIDDVEFVSLSWTFFT
jgi:hypothetical protein